MNINELLERKKMTKYRLSKLAEIPYATISDICLGKTELSKCNAETVYRISQILNVSMETLLAPFFMKRASFENFKSATCHRVKELGDIEFIIYTLENREIRLLFEREWYPESFYLLAMLDYLSRENNIPICDEYDDIRACKLKDPLYPTSIIALSSAVQNEDALKRAKRTAIPEFKRFNIIENEVRNVI